MGMLHSKDLEFKGMLHSKDLGFMGMLHSVHGDVTIHSMDL